jgi:hypothetical protein
MFICGNLYSNNTQNYFNTVNCTCKSNAENKSYRDYVSCKISLKGVLIKITTSQSWFYVPPQVTGGWKNSTFGANGQATLNADPLANRTGFFPPNGHLKKEVEPSSEASWF